MRTFFHYHKHVEIEIKIDRHSFGKQEFNNHVLKIVQQKLLSNDEEEGAHKEVNNKKGSKQSRNGNIKGRLFDYHCKDWRDMLHAGAEGMWVVPPPHLDLNFFIGIVTQGLLCKYLNFEVGFVRSQNLSNKTIITFSKNKHKK